MNEIYSYLFIFLFYGRNESQQKKYLTIVSNEVKRLSRMVVSMLNLSKIEAGQLDLNFNDVDLSDMILGTFLNLEQKINEGKIEIRGLDLLGKRFGGFHFGIYCR